MPSYVKPRGNGFVYRRDIPERWRPILGKTAWFIKLDADNRTKAETLGAVHAREHDAILTRLRQAGPTVATRQHIEEVENQAREAVQAIARGFFAKPRSESDLQDLWKRQASREQAVRDRVHGPRQLDLERQVFVKTAPGLVDAMITAAEASVPKLTAEDQERIKAEGGIRTAFATHENLRRGSAVIQSAIDMLSDTDTEAEESEDAEALRLGRAMRDIATLTKEQTETVGDLQRLRTALEPVGLVASAPITPAPVKASSTSDRSILKVFDKWLKAKSQRPDTVRKWRVYVRRFVDVHGDLPVKDITKAMVRDYVNAIASLPDSRGLKPELRKGSVQDLMDWLEDEPEAALISPATVTKHLDCMKALLTWCSQEDYTESNVAQTLRAPVDARFASERVRPFTREELNAILNEARTAWQATPDRIMLLTAAIYTGARLEELAQLGKSNLKPLGNGWFIEINKEDGRQIKNESSIRSIPLHPDLIAAGFVEHVQKSKGSLVFQSFTKTAGRYGHNVSNAFHRLLRVRLEITDRRVHFHAIRHAFADACREGGVPQDVRYRLMGHVEANKVAGNYGAGFPVKVLASWMEKIQPL